jgi:hypothetical protein
MYSKRHNLTLGFHGCDKSLRDQIIVGKKIQYKSNNNWDWLGHGMYFWEYIPLRAYEYALLMRDNPHRSRSKIETPSVLGAIIDLGQCLDLLDSSFLKMAKQAYEELKKSVESAGFDMPMNIPIENETDILIRNLDCAVIETIHKIHKEGKKEPFDSVRSVFFEGSCLYDNAGFKEKNHIQICVRNPNCIKGYFIPRELDDNWDE